MKTLSYNFFDLKTVHVHSSSAEILEETDKLFSNFRNEKAKLSPVDEENVFLEESNDKKGKYQINWGSHASTSNTLLSLITNLNYLLNTKVLADLPFLIVHASVVSYNSDLLVFIGDCDYGKTTLSFALVSQGFKYFSDEYAVLDLVNKKILPYPRSGFLSQTSSDLLKEVDKKFVLGNSDSYHEDSVVNPLTLFPQGKVKEDEYNRIFFFNIQSGFNEEPEISPISNPHYS